MARTEHSEPQGAATAAHGPASSRSAAVEWLGGWWRIVSLGARVLVLTLTPSSYTRAHRGATLARIYLATAPLMLWLTVLSSVVSLGHVFHPAVTLVFVLKTLLLSFAVAVIPAGSALFDPPRQDSRQSAEIRVLVRLSLAILLIESLSLVGNYY